jgi:hypothetical protein
MSSSAITALQRFREHGEFAHVSNNSMPQIMGFLHAQPQTGPLAVQFPNPQNHACKHLFT